MKKTFYLLLFTLYVSISLAQSPCREVVGYYPGWQWYDRNKLVQPSSIDYSKYTYLQYAFMNMDADGHLLITDPWGDKNLLLGDINWNTAPVGYDSAYDLGNPDYHIPNTNLAFYAHLNDVKLLMSIGGWTLSTHFPGIASDPVKRATFAADCVEICELYELDGIDIDWEYPIDNTQGENFTLLLEDIRSALDGAEIELGRELYLSAAVSAGNNMAYIEWNEVSQILDMINLMSYDYYGTWDPMLNHNAPLFDPEQGIDNFSCDGSVQRLVTEFNVDPTKINMGIPFYGRSQLSTNTPALFGAGNGTADNSHFGIDEGTPLYYNVLLQQDNFSVYWDDIAQVPYMISTQNNSFVSYDDEQSVEEKAQYIADNGLRGAIIWEITGDYIETSPGSGVIAGTPLADKISEVFCQTPENVHETEASLELYPNPASSFVTIQTKGIEAQTIKIEDACGALVTEEKTNGSSVRINISHLPQGYYIITIGNSKKGLIKTGG
jgi:GH18 family chitinase